MGLGSPEGLLELVEVYGVAGRVVEGVGGLVGVGGNVALLVE